MKPLPPEVPVSEIETRPVLKKLAGTRAALAELKGIAATIPNEQILIDTLSIQEAKDSSAIENIVTTHDELYQSSYEGHEFPSPAAKEVHSYVAALKLGFRELKQNGFISLNAILRIQQVIERNNAGFRRTPGTVLKNDLTQEVVYTPPQHNDEITALMSNLEWFINNPDAYETDPLVKMALIHHQFESIHPFYDGNGRTGRILNILYLIQSGLLSLPVLYLSRYIIRHRQAYYQLLQQTRATGHWEPWVLYMLDAVEQTALGTIETIRGIKQLMQQYKQQIRSGEPRMYSQDLINNLFRHPYTKITLLQPELQVSRITASRYLERLVEMGLLAKHKAGRTNYYVNSPLVGLLIGTESAQ